MDSFLLYQDLIKRNEVLADGRLPPILPIVLYNGGRRWTAATDVCELIPPVPGLVEQFKPKFKYLLIDENAYSESELASLKNLVAAVFRIEHPASPEAIDNLPALLAGRPPGFAQHVRHLDTGDLDAQDGIPYRTATIE